VLTSDNPAVIDELEYLTDDQREDFRELLGSLRGDTSLNQMKNRLQTIMSSPYPTRAGSDLALLAQIGVSTNASSGNSGGSLNFSKLRGYLEIDEDTLDGVLQSEIEAVKDLFGNDTTGDLVINTGVARAVDEYLTPYTQTGGFVSTRIARITGQIDSTKDDISDYEDYREDYEADLKRQYGIMESTLNQLENSSRDLENFSSQQRSGR
jgi:flagellar hook-associated protein 2